MYSKRNYSVMPRTIGGLIEDVLHNGYTRINEEISSVSAPVNIQETDKSYELHLVAPGLKKEDFKINIDQNILHISYDHRSEQGEQPEEGKQNEQTENKWLRKEYRMRSFKRSFTLNDKIDTANISAKYADGILQVTMLKKEKSEPAVQQVSVN